MNIDDYLTHVSYPEDFKHLTTNHLDVNMRLFNSSPEYREIIRSQCSYISKICLTKMDGYKKPHGMSAANLGLGLNIIGVTCNRNKPDEYCQIMINPKIVESKGSVTAMSNCGSIRLDEPIPVKRAESVKVEYYNVYGDRHCEEFDRQNGSLTIQHEVEHNLGILITSD